MTRPAQTLSGLDRGRRLRATIPGGRHSDTRTIKGQLLEVNHLADGTVLLVVIDELGADHGSVNALDHVEIEGMVGAL